MRKANISNFTIDDLHSLEKAKTLMEAQEMAIDIVNKCRTNTNPTKVGVLIGNIRAAIRKSDVLTIMWNIALSGEKLSVVDSRYQAKFA